MSRKKQFTVLFYGTFCRNQPLREIASKIAFLIVTQLGVRILIRPNTMWRAFFCAIGIVLIIMGIECLLIDSAVLVAGVLDDPNIQIQQQTGGLFSPPVQSTMDRVFRPSEWFPWSLLACGAITLLYSISLRKPV
jgi:hypothetical protein